MASIVCFREQIEGYREIKRLGVPKRHKEVLESRKNLMFLIELRKKVSIFRDIIDLQPCSGSRTLKELLMITTEELHRRYPEDVPSVPIPELKETHLYQGLVNFYNALKSVGDAWVKNHKWLAEFECKESGEMENFDPEEFGERVLEKLTYMIKMAMELYGEMEEGEEQNSDKNPEASKFEEVLFNVSYSNNDGSFCKSLATPNSVLPMLKDSCAESGEFAYSPPLTRPLRTSVGKLKPIDLRPLLSFTVLPHLLAHGSRTMNGRSKTSDEKIGPESQEVNRNMAKPNPESKEESGDCIATCETQHIAVSSTSYIANSYTTPKTAVNMVPPTSVTTNVSPVQSTKPKPSTLLPSALQAPPPPPPRPFAVKYEPNVSLATTSPPRLQWYSLPNVSAKPEPPALPKFMPNICGWPHVAYVAAWSCAQSRLHGPVHGYGHGHQAPRIHCSRTLLQAWLHIPAYSSLQCSTTLHMLAALVGSQSTISPLPPQSLVLPDTTPQSLTKVQPQNLLVLPPVEPQLTLPPNATETLASTSCLPRCPSNGLLPSTPPPLLMRNGGDPPSPRQPLATLPPITMETLTPASSPPTNPSKEVLPSRPPPLQPMNGGAPLLLSLQPLPMLPPNATETLPPSSPLLKNGGDPSPLPAQLLPTLPSNAPKTSTITPPPSICPSNDSLPSRPPTLPLSNGGAHLSEPTPPLAVLPPIVIENSVSVPPPPTCPSEGSLPLVTSPLSPKNKGAPSPPLAQPLPTLLPNATEALAQTPPPPICPSQELLPSPPPPSLLKNGVASPPSAQPLPTLPPNPVESSAPPSPTHPSKESPHLTTSSLKNKSTPPTPPAQTLPILSPNETKSSVPPPRPSTHLTKGSFPSPPPPPPSTHPTKGYFPSPPPPPPSTHPTKGSFPSPSPPPPSMHPTKGSFPSPPPPLPPKNGGAPPLPPPVGGPKLGFKKANTKLKRSRFMGNLYRLLKGKVEGSSIDGKSSHERKTQLGGSAGGNKGMADALAEMTKRSPYYQQIEEDVKKHAATILELKKSITSFKTKDMVELLKFHQHVEHHLENLSSETQVLARFEDFPTRKLETLRMAAALYSRLRAIVTTLENWKMVEPLSQLLDKIERYFNKIKVEVDAVERVKDEESKKFKSCNIDFDFNILIQIKELIVDISSGCMELALKEGKTIIPGENGTKSGDALLKACIETLWRAFQLAFRVYSFAGGQDDRADRLSKELASEIERVKQCAVL